ncbi:MAG: outer membrane protein assembly factor BamB [Spiribacter sp.]|nr:outer membrane protein assembly factor BamB [Spiribacter sp.]
MNAAMWKWIVVASLSILIAGCGSSGPMRADDAPAVELADDGPMVRVVWSANVGDARTPHHRLELALQEDLIVAAAADGQVTAFDAASGEVQWQVSLDVQISGGPGAGEEGIALGTADGEILLLSESDGSVRWRSRVSSEVLAPPAVGQDTVVARTGDGRVFALEASDGSQRWLYSRSVPSLSLRGHSAPVLVRNGVVSGFDNGRLSALALTDGDPAWEATVAVPEGRTDLERMIDIDADPLVARGDLFAGAYQGRLTGISLGSGDIAWARELSLLGGLAVDSSNLYATDAEGRVWALDRRNGASVWRADDLSGTMLTAPALHAETIAVAGSDGYVTWLGPDDGRLLARHQVGGAKIAAAPLEHAGRLYVLDLDGRLHAVEIDQ